jgi:hypothetical protein
MGEGLGGWDGALRQNHPHGVALLWRCNIAATKRAGKPRRKPRTDHLSSFFGAAAAGQRLEEFDLFSRLLINGGVAEVDVPVQARVRVVLVVGGWVRWVRGRLLLVHSDSLQDVVCGPEAGGTGRYPPASILS